MKREKGRDTMPILQLWPDCLLEEECSCLATSWAVHFYTSLSPGADVSNSPGVSSTETSPAELSSALA